ncbi:MAG: hypothetical protein OEY34_02575, partial [Cyclobacteriaceae bacterium]|nr:hypothetical protein [Cyclobacteriaceae bacterium]
RLIQLPYYKITILFILIIAFNQSIDSEWSVISFPVESKYDEPREFINYHLGIRTREGEQAPGYLPGYRILELQKQIERKSKNNLRIEANGVVGWTERGPGNVPGRTRDILIWPGDPTNKTFFAGSAGGGIWKTVDEGLNWTNVTPDIPVMSISSIACADSSPAIIYAGTGEDFTGFNNIRGDGILKSTDSGNTWAIIPSTIGNADFQTITRLVVNPQNPNILLASTVSNNWSSSFQSGIMKSTNGGTSWTKVYSSQSGIVQQIVATPGNFNVLYAAFRGNGILKSSDMGNTWQLISSGFNINGRIELDVSPVNPLRLFASAEGNISGTGSDLYTSSDGGITWNGVNVNFSGNPVDFLGGQGWYDNTIACDPFNEKVVYYGGVNMFRTEVLSTFTTSTSYTVDQGSTIDFMDFVNFGATYYNGKLEVAEFANGISVELRYGPGKGQKAHRFMVPPTIGSGALDTEYDYYDYVDIPFEVWDVTNNRQLMISFRDQQRDGSYTLIHQNTTGDPLTHSREYFFINDVDYKLTPDPNIAKNAGHTYRQMYFMWPVLQSTAIWNPSNLPSSTLSIIASTGEKLFNGNTLIVSDAYNEFDGKNSFEQFTVSLHPDHHVIRPVITNANSKQFKLINGNDGGVFVSSASITPGITEGEWKFSGRGYRTSQLYGVAKKPGEHVYIGGMQDNGTWLSPSGSSPTASTVYDFVIGGDGFEVLWNYNNTNLIIGSSQYNRFRRTEDGGATWTTTTTGIEGDSPFFSKISNSNADPNVIFTVTSEGVFKSTNFGTSWQKKPITSFWTGNNYLDVEVSKANSNIVWAGSGMSSSSKLHVSLDKGESFQPVNNYNGQTMGVITSLGTHPYEENTAYALFSFSDGPKVLRTTDLGVNWVDISGFNGNPESNNGFPDVSAYCIYVRPDNPNIIWVGTDIGIVESLDNGQTWNLIQDFPNLSVWEMKGDDNQVVIATHGRGIWTAEMESNQMGIELPIIDRHGTTPDGDFIVESSLSETYDSLVVILNNKRIKSIKNPQIGKNQITFNYNPGIYAMKILGYKKTAPFYSKEIKINYLNLKLPSQSYGTDFENSSNDFYIDNNFTISKLINIDRKVLMSNFPFPNNTNSSNYLLTPIIVNNSNSKIYYSDIALIEPGDNSVHYSNPLFKDYVIIEGTTNGLDWIPISDGYDANFYTDWVENYNNSTITPDRFFFHSIDLNTVFNAGQKVLFRFRLFSDSNETGWGWAIDNLYIQQSIPLKIELYPNPSPDNIYVKIITSDPTDLAFKLFDSNGRLHLKTSHQILEAG